MNALNSLPVVKPAHQPAVKFSASDDPDPFGIGEYKDSKMDAYIPSSKPRKGKKPRINKPKSSQKETAKHVAKKTGWGLVAAACGFLGFTYAGDTIEAYSSDTAAQNAYEEVKAETEEIKAEGEAAIHLQHYFGEIYNNLYLNGQLDFDQVNQINQQIERLDDTNLTPEQKTQLNILVEASGNVDNVDEMKALNEEFLNFYVQDVDLREQLLEKSNEMLDAGYVDSLNRNGVEKVFNPLLTLIYLDWARQNIKRAKNVKKPEPKKS